MIHFYYTFLNPFHTQGHMFLGIYEPMTTGMGTQYNDGIGVYL